MVVRDSAEKTIEAIEFLLPSTVKEGLWWNTFLYVYFAWVYYVYLTT